MVRSRFWNLVSPHHALHAEALAATRPPKTIPSDRLRSKANLILVGGIASLALAAIFVAMNAVGPPSNLRYALIPLVTAMGILNIAISSRLRTFSRVP